MHRIELVNMTKIVRLLGFPGLFAMAYPLLHYHGLCKRSSNTVVLSECWLFSSDLDEEGA